MSARRTGEVILAVGLGLTTVLGATACGKSSAEEIGGANIAQRYSHDYTGDSLDSWGVDEANSYCLAGSAYDLFRARGTSAALRVEADGTIVITPPSGDGDALRLKDEGTDEPLQPADGQSARILDAFGCPTDPYEN